MLIAGVDLAWSGRKPTGICLLDAASGSVELLELRCTEATHTALEIAAWLDSLGPDVVAGIDAPLIVTDQRRAEAELARRFGRQGVFAYAARNGFLDRHGILEGPRLGDRLAGGGWNLDPAHVTAGTSGRHALELFPHAIIVSLFGAPSALKYKKGARQARLGPLADFQSLLRTHCSELLPGALSRGIFSEVVSVVPGRQLKAIEDQLDALACALGAYHIWKSGPSGTLVFGDAGNGYIAVPRPVTSSLEPSYP
jgi:predicted RNase H-like nuclease